MEDEEEGDRTKGYKCHQHNDLGAMEFGPKPGSAFIQPDLDFVEPLSFLGGVCAGRSLGAPDTRGCVMCDVRDILLALEQ